MNNPMKQTLFILYLLVSLTFTAHGQSSRADQLVDQAFAAMDRKDFRSALQAFDQAISLGENSKEIIGLRNGCIGEIVGVYRENSKYSDAIDYIDNFIAREADNGYLYKLKAELLADTGDIDKSIDYYNKAIELTPTDYEVYLSLGITLYFEAKEQMKQGNTTIAKGLFQNALNVFNQTHQVLVLQNYPKEAFDNIDELIQDYINEIKGLLK